MTSTPDLRVGTVAIIGRPNVGKSTLMNTLLEYKLSAVSPKPQTTRHNILGVLSGEHYQVIFLDTPGIPLKPGDELNRRLLGRAFDSLQEADLVLMMAEPKPPADIERTIISRIKRARKPSVLALNKVDLVEKTALLPVIDEYSKIGPFLEIVPVSALKRDGLNVLLEALVRHLPEGEPVFPPDEFTDRTERFLAAEAIREQIFKLYAEEIPYSVAVEIDDFKEQSPEHGGKDYIAATLYVEKDSQKAIVIGKGGEMMKRLGMRVRQQLESTLGRPLYLELWVKVYPHWRKDRAFLNRIGY